MNKRLTLLLSAVLSVGLLAAGCGEESKSSSSSSKEKSTPAKSSDAAMEKDAMEKDAMEKDSGKMMSFENVKSPHFLSSTPANNATVAAGSIENVALSFDFDLAGDSTIKVTRDGTDVTTGATTIVGDKLKLMVPVTTTAAGAYKVAYTACWPDGSCHDGSFGFNVKA